MLPLAMLDAVRRRAVQLVGLDAPLFAVRLDAGAGEHPSVAGGVPVGVEAEHLDEMIRLVDGGLAAELESTVVDLLGELVA